jgi:hypothetical protein
VEPSGRGRWKAVDDFDWAAAATAMAATDRRDGRAGRTGGPKVLPDEPVAGVDTPEQACFNFKCKLSSHS